MNAVVRTGLVDVTGCQIYVGDMLYNLLCKYHVIVQQDADGGFSGRLVCDPSHSCANIPYCLNRGKDHIVCPNARLDRDVRLIAVKDIRRGVDGISGSGVFQRKTRLYGRRGRGTCWHVWDRNNTWPWCVHVPDSFVEIEEPNTMICESEWKR